MLVIGGNERDNILMKVLTSGITKLKKLQEVKMKDEKIIGIQ